MVGIPKSNRCTFCKLRKTKCDENWPTCGACARAGKVCSGARNNYKFVVNGCHNEEPTPKSSDSDDASISSCDGSQIRGPLSRRSSPGGTIIVDMKEYTANLGPGTFHRMRLTRPHRPRSVKHGRPTSIPSPTPSPVMSPSDRLASQFVSCIEAASGTGHDLLIWGPSIKMIPQRLGSESPVLRHTVELVVASWTNSQRDVMSPETWLDLQLHMQALGSLRKALAEPSQGLVTDTITAQWLLQKLELTYDFERGANRENHAAGLTAVISRGGPWQGFQDLGLYATFDSFFNMLQEDVRLGRDSIFMNCEWIAALKQAVDGSMLRPVVKAMYRLWIEMTVWPTLVGLVRILGQNSSDTMTAFELLTMAKPVIDYLEQDCDATLTSLRNSGDIMEVENVLDADLFPTCYHFRDIDTAKFFYTHAMYSIIIHRTMQEANLVFDNYIPSVMKKCRECSKRIWMAYPWMRTQRPLAIEYTAALAFSYESANEEEREFCIRSLDDMEYFRRPPPIGRWIDATIMANVKGYTGRMPFIKDQDVTIELYGLGCRC
ncbi:uncharacterized protein F4807DRAFT_244283 [Annulohypoxylon truncatum]|uniref:uncharacterized protein n=1 Tax=Annulohypoxylon truncatum TaxID=327061 RepID=UPI0020076CB0|nr:uncharacterized protein F4807DRAFT_244283 [Annulohypoxylon truncatum]KAI1206070.1 hypothetical protein F4807DRAFT_244283 [Annulohypoxylon truncatum]